MPHYNNLVVSQMEEQLRRFIQAGGYAPHDRLPSERELAEALGTSRMTVRTAVKKMCAEGRLYSRVGSGTFVAPPRWQRNATFLQNSPTGFAEEHRLKVTILSVKKRRMRSDIAWEAGWDASQSYYEVRLLYHYHSQPLTLETSYIPALLCPYLERGDMHDLNRLLREEYGLNLTRLATAINIIGADEAPAGLLGIPQGAYVVQEKKIYHGEEGAVLKLSVALTAFDRVQYVMDLTEKL